MIDMTDTDKQQLLSAIAKLWARYPQQRLGQLLWNYGFKDDRRVFAMPDEDLERNIISELKKKELD